MRLDIDHVPFAAASLESATEKFDQLGIPTQYGGKHPDAGTEMALIPLPDGTYIEVIAPIRDDPDYWPEFLAADAGPCSWCVRSEQVHAECQRIIEHDVQVSGPIRGSRERPDGVLVEWDHAFIGGPDDHTFPFVVTDRTPQAYRIPDSELHSSPISGIGSVVLAVSDIAAVTDRFLDLYRLPRPTRDTDSFFGDIVEFPGHTVHLASPGNGPLTDRLERFGDAPAAILLEGDIDEARSEYPLGNGTTWFGRTVAFFDGFDRQLGIIESPTENRGRSTQ